MELSLKLLLTPLAAFGVYMLLAGILSLVGRALAGPDEQSAVKSSAYASGEVGSYAPAAPGYRQFFTAALFFAVLHLGVLMAGSGSLTWVTGAYLTGLILALLALILG